MKKLITIVYFQIGVNVIGFPDIINHRIKNYATRSTLAFKPIL